MRQFRPCLTFAALLLLAACSEKQTTQLQQTASAAIGAVHKSVEASSQPLGELKKHASAAAGAAVLLNPQLKEKLDQVKQQASAALGVVRQAPGG